MKRIIKHKHTHTTLFFILKIVISVTVALGLINWYNQYSFKRRIAENGKKVVMVLTKNGGGTGFHVIAPSGKIYIVTNHHVCYTDEATDKVKILSGDRSDIKVIVKHNSNLDLCAISPITHEHFEVAEKYEDGKVYTLTHPNLNPMIYMEGNTLGNIKMLNKVLISTNFRVTGGSSGSPILNFDDKVIGVIVMVDSRSSLYLAAAVTTANLIKFLSDL